MVVSTQTSFTRRSYLTPLGRVACLACVFALAVPPPIVRAKGRAQEGRAAKKPTGPTKNDKPAKAKKGPPSKSKQGTAGKVKKQRAPQAKLGKPGKAKTGKASVGQTPRAASTVIRPDVLAWIMANNPGLPVDFLRTEPPGRSIKIPDGRTVPIYRLTQFLDMNFRLTFFARKKEKGSKVVPVMEQRLRKLLALPAFYERVRTHRAHYKIHPKGKVTALAAYNHFRHVKRNLGVTAGKQFKAPVGGGGGIAAPSWATWKAMNLFFHEACHCIGIGHDSGGLSGPIAGTLRRWDRQKRWNYDTIDLNSLTVAR